MPHKHTRKGEDKSSINLPPTIIAKPLPVAKSAKSNGIFTADLTRVRKGKRKLENDDDTPRAFARLMSFREGKRLPKGLDDGVKPGKRQKHSEKLGQSTGSNPVSELKTARLEPPTIQPGEKMSEFAARVDAALPLSGLMNKTVKGGKDPLGLRVIRTKKEKKMHRMYDEWREQDRKIKEKRQEALELAREEDNDEELGVKWRVDMESTESRRREKRKSKKSKVYGEIGDGDDDPWAALAKSRNEGPKRLNDVVQAPPQSLKVPTEKFKIHESRATIMDLPKASGSLRRREALLEVRKSVVEGYRRMMKDDKAAAGR